MNEPSLTVTSYTNCSVFYCSYIVGADTGHVKFNRTALEDYVTVQLRATLSSMVVYGTNADAVSNDGGSSVVFVVNDVSEEAMAFEIVSVDPASSEAAKENMFWIIGPISGIFCFAGFAALCYEKGAIPKVIPTVDTSK